MKLQSIDPYTNKLIYACEELSDKQIEASLINSEKAFNSWKAIPYSDRSKFLYSTSDLLLNEIEELAATITMEMGKPVKESRSEIEKCAWVCRYYAEHAEIFLQSRSIATDSKKSYVRYDPLGTILGIMPWNFPFWQVFRFAAPTLMAGNTILLKHASNVQKCALHIQEILLNAGFPEYVFQSLPIGSSRVKQIIESRIVKAVTLTGSEAAGSNVAELAGRNIKKTVLELGGSNAFIVLKDADLEQAASVGVQARMMNAGQSCIAAKRFIVIESVAEKYIQLLSTKINDLKAGDPFDETTDLGPLANREQATILHRQVNESNRMGATLVTGGTMNNAFYTPTLLTGVKPGMPVFEEEVFGPVLPVVTVKNTDEAIQLSNQSTYGLGVSLFTSDIEHAEKLVPQFEDGAVFINALVKSDPRLPFGGTKNSGFGRELSEEGIREFVNCKTVYCN